MAELARLKQARFLAEGLLAEFNRCGFTDSEVNHRSNPLMLVVERSSESIPLLHARWIRDGTLCYF